MKIESFIGEYRFLSNFYPVQVKLDGIPFPSVENAYQAAKTDRKNWYKFQSITASQAKQLGKKLKIRKDWEYVKSHIMFGLLRQKFEDTYFMDKLLKTGDSELVEGNTWGDTYWGVCGGEGENILGKMLMAIRDDFNSLDGDKDLKTKLLMMPIKPTEEQITILNSTD